MNLDHAFAPIEGFADILSRTDSRTALVLLALCKQAQHDLVEEPRQGPQDPRSAHRAAVAAVDRLGNLVDDKASRDWVAVVRELLTDYAPAALRPGADPLGRGLAAGLRTNTDKGEETCHV